MSTDILHSPGSHENWNESFYFNFYDREKHICGFMRIGLQKNKNEKNMFCFLMLPDGTHLGIKGIANYEDEKLSVNNLTYHKHLDERHWELAYDGAMKELKDCDEETLHHVTFNLDYKAINKIFNYRNCAITEEAELLSQQVASEHLEQYGNITGTIKIDEQEYIITAMGERDHSWGVRDWNAPEQWIWLTCQFNEDTAFNITQLTMQQGQVNCGFIHINGENKPIINVDIDTTYEQGRPTRFLLELLTATEETYTITAENIDHILVPFHNTQDNTLAHMYENLARYTMDEKTGYGIAEFLIKQ